MTLADINPIAPFQTYSTNEPPPSLTTGPTDELLCQKFQTDLYEYTLCTGTGRKVEQFDITYGDVSNLGIFDPSLTTRLGTSSGTYGWRGGANSWAYGDRGSTPSSYLRTSSKDHLFR